MHKLTLSIVLTSQGISFLHAGSEFLRSKMGNDNSYNAGDSINAIDWSLKTKNKDVFEYVKALIKMRKEHPAFRMITTEQISDNLKFIDNLQEGLIAYTINGASLNDKWKKIFVLFNGSNNKRTFVLPSSKQGWRECVIGNKNAAEDNLRRDGKIRVLPFSSYIFYQD